jgi:hypothetical protein
MFALLYGKREAEVGEREGLHWRAVSVMLVLVLLRAAFILAAIGVVVSVGGQWISNPSRPPKYIQDTFNS